MSLDITLRGAAEDEACRECGHTRPVKPRLFEANITHNLGSMADAAGIYGVVWEPGENGIKTAHDLIEPLTRGIDTMKADPDRFKAFDAANGWGTYNSFVPWLERYLEACTQHPNAEVSASP